jgi:ribosomal protein S18 acetylase RimI-like enzyme
VGSIRLVRRDDTDAVYDICLRTADAGGDASHLYDDPRLPGHVWAGPYVAHEPEHGFVVVDDADVPIGYILGASDSRAFEALLERAWWPALRDRYAPDVPRASAAERIAVHLIHHPPTADPSVVEAYPSHLHIDLLPAAQGHGDGRRLIDRLLESLSAAGSPGVHLGVSSRNEHAIGFYRAVGFTELHRDDRHMVFGHRW